MDHSTLLVLLLELVQECHMQICTYMHIVDSKIETLLSPLLSGFNDIIRGDLLKFVWIVPLKNSSPWLL